MFTPCGTYNHSTRACPNQQFITPIILFTKAMVTVNNLRCVDDTVLMAEYEMRLQEMADVIGTESQNQGLSLNSRGTAVMEVARKQCISMCNIVVDGIGLRWVGKIKCFGALMAAGGRCIRWVKYRVAQVKAAFNKLMYIVYLIYLYQ